MELLHHAQIFRVAVTNLKHTPPTYLPMNIL